MVAKGEELLRYDGYKFCVGENKINIKGKVGGCNDIAGISAGQI